MVLSLLRVNGNTPLPPTPAAAVTAVLSVTSITEPSLNRA